MVKLTINFMPSVESTAGQLQRSKVFDIHPIELTLDSKKEDEKSKNDIIKLITNTLTAKNKIIYDKPDKPYENLSTEILQKIKASKDGDSQILYISIYEMPGEIQTKIDQFIDKIISAGENIEKISKIKPLATIESSKQELIKEYKDLPLQEKEICKTKLRDKLANINLWSIYHHIEIYEPSEVSMTGRLIIYIPELLEILAEITQKSIDDILRIISTDTDQKNEDMIIINLAFGDFFYSLSSLTTPNNYNKLKIYLKKYVLRLRIDLIDEILKIEEKKLESERQSSVQLEKKYMKYKLKYLKINKNNI